MLVTLRGLRVKSHKNILFSQMKSRCGLKRFAQEFGGMGGEFSDLWYPMSSLNFYCGF